MFVLQDELERVGQYGLRARGKNLSQIVDVISPSLREKRMSTR